jgi:hypothetical protein
MSSNAAISPYGPLEHVMGSFANVERHAHGVMDLTTREHKVIRSTARISFGKMIRRDMTETAYLEVRDERY